MYISFKIDISGFDTFDANYVEVLYVCITFITDIFIVTWQPGYLSRYGDSLLAGRSRHRMQVGGKISGARPNRPWGPPSLLYNGYRVFPGGKAAEAWC